MKPLRSIDDLIAVMAALRTPVTGCPWDLEQTFETIAPYTVEEAYEVADAIHRVDMDDLRDELGDLLLQVVYHARMAEEAGEFDFGDVVEAITRKMIRRHPHVFGDAGRRSTAQVNTTWETIKEEERAEKRARRAARGLAPDEHRSLLDSVPQSLPALTAALKLQRKAATVGFDWSEAEPILAKIEEEIGELRQAMAGGDVEPVADELGDTIFAVVNLARHLGIDAEQALAATNRKFKTRFRFIEAQLARAGRSPKDASLDEMERLWQQAKSNRGP